MAAAESRKLAELDDEECFALLAPGGVGRVAFTDFVGPAVVPVNFVLDGRVLVFRTALGGWLDQSLTTSIAGADVRIAFEVDDFDPATRTGWSVLARGGAHHVPAAEAGDLRVDSWAGDDRQSYIRLTPREISGRRVRA
ncbi:pyridoxamine 5'-phosphate oxidase family protein [Actinocorallia populi]|uniref:pyridoxamine 5'-phosphate oxidase family protein n=1 Tax=Actinocorallia populi TaxID=2079200 RepID=UPI000D08D526|nr:pyridoxamine 5'-phosphate oxidase family protein [Actinocorallia populi]